MQSLLALILMQLQLLTLTNSKQVKRHYLLGGLCATALTAAAVLSVVSCSGDDEYYEGGNYTLANRRVTRGLPDGPDGFAITNNNNGYKENECAIWCLAEMFGDSKSVRNVIKQANIDYTNGLQQSSILQISDSLGYGLSGFMNDTYMENGEVVTKKGRAVEQLQKLTDDNGKINGNVMVFIDNHCSIAVSIDVNKRCVKVKDYNAQTRSYSFSQIKGVLW